MNIRNGNLSFLNVFLIPGFWSAGPITLRLPVSVRQPGPGVRAGCAAHSRRMRMLSGVRPTRRGPMRRDRRVRPEEGIGVPVRRLLQSGGYMQR